MHTNRFRMWTRCICSVHVRTEPKGPYRKCSVQIHVMLHPYYILCIMNWSSWINRHVLLLDLNCVMPAHWTSALPTCPGFGSLRLLSLGQNVKCLCLDKTVEIHLRSQIVWVTCLQITTSRERSTHGRGIRSGALLHNVPTLMGMSAEFKSGTVFAC